MATPLTYKSPIHVLANDNHAVNVVNGGIYVKRDISLRGSINSPQYVLTDPGWYSLCHVDDLGGHSLHVVIYSLLSNTYVDLSAAKVLYYSIGETPIVDDAHMFDGTLYVRFLEPTTIHVHAFGGGVSQVNMRVSKKLECTWINQKTTIRGLRLHSPLIVNHSQHESIDCKRLLTGAATFNTSQTGPPGSQTSGERIRLYPPGLGLGYAIGMEPGHMWFSAEKAQSGFKWYTGGPRGSIAGYERMALLGDGRLTVQNALQIGDAPGKMGSRLHVSGPANSPHGPHLCLSANGTPRFSVLAWDRNDVSVGLDAHYDGNDWVSNSETSAFRIHKRQNELAVLCRDGMGAGEWKCPFSIHKTGRVVCASSLLAASLVPLTPRATVGTSSNPFHAVHTAKIMCKPANLSLNMTPHAAKERLRHYTDNLDPRDIDIVHILGLLITCVME